MKIRLKLFVSFIVVLLSAKSFSQSGSSITISPAITAQSNAFKSLVGQDRITQFKALETLFVTIESKTTCDGTISADFTNRTELYRLLGTPNSILSPNLVAYKLSASITACEAVDGIDNSGILLFTQINKCP